MIAGSPGAVEATAYDMKRAGVGLGEVAQAIRDHGHRVTSDWDGSASVAASLAITHLSNRTWVGSDVAAAMVPVLLDYAGELRLAQDDYAMGAAAAATGTQSKAAADAAVAAAGAAGVVDHLNEAASAAAGAQISAGHADMLAAVKREERANELAADQVVELTGRLSDMTAEVLSPPQHMPLYGSGDGPDFGAEPMSVGAVLSRAASQPSSTSSLWAGRDLSDDAWEYVKGGVRGYGNAAKDSWSSIKEVATQSPLTTGKEMAAGVATTYADGGVNGLFQTYINPVDDCSRAPETLPTTMWSIVTRGPLVSWRLRERSRSRRSVSVSPPQGRASRPRSCSKPCDFEGLGRRRVRSRRRGPARRLHQRRARTPRRLQIRLPLLQRARRPRRPRCRMCRVPPSATTS